MNKILIIEDSNEINNLLKEILTQNNYEVVQAYSGSEGLMYYRNEVFSLILLDLMLPGVAGEDVLREIRTTSNIPIIVISAKTDIDGKVELLTHGADDYITKPFDVREVIARIELQLKKQVPESIDKITYNELILDDNTHQVYVNGQPLALTRQEYNIIYTLMKHPNKVFSKQELFEIAWEQYYVGEDKTINVHISNIRKKIKQYSPNDYIATVWGIGFKLNDKF